MSSKPTLTLRLGASHRDRLETFELPASWQVCLCPPVGAPELSERQLRQAFAQTLGAPPIHEQARGAESAVILVDDFRRPTPAETLCLQVLSELTQAGISKDGIRIVLGNGAHRIMTERECRHRLGAAFDEVAEVISHDAFSRDVSFVGVTAAGTPVLVNRAAAAADYSVSISTVYPHSLTAWGGGAKMVLPGVTHVATSYCHHTRLPSGVWGGNPDENIARQDIEEAAELFGLNASVCAVVGVDRQLIGLRVGNPRQAHVSAVRLARAAYATDVSAVEPDLIVANAYPMDGDPTQMSKTQIPARRVGEAPILIVMDFADPCPWHGVYHGEREKWLRCPQPEMPELTSELLAQAQVFMYSPQAGKGYVPVDRSWYCDHDWDRLMQAMSTRFPAAKVAVLPSAPLQMPIRP